MQLQCEQLEILKIKNRLCKRRLIEWIAKLTYSKFSCKTTVSLRKCASEKISWDWLSTLRISRHRTDNSTWKWTKWWEWTSTPASNSKEMRLLCDWRREILRRWPDLCDWSNSRGAKRLSWPGLTKLRRVKSFSQQTRCDENLQEILEKIRD